MEKLTPTAVPRRASQEQSDIFGRLADTVQQMDDAAREEGRPPPALPADTQRIREVNEFISSWQR